MERNCARNLALAILVGDTFGKIFLRDRQLHFKVASSIDQHTFVNTAIEAYEFPKLMPTTGGSVDI